MYFAVNKHHVNQLISLPHVTNITRRDITFQLLFLAVWVSTEYSLINQHQVCLFFKLSSFGGPGPGTKITNPKAI